MPGCRPRIGLHLRVGMFVERLSRKAASADGKVIALPTRTTALSQLCHSTPRGRPRGGPGLRSAGEEAIVPAVARVSVWSERTARRRDPPAGAQHPADPVEDPPGR